jgi:hypothetical protein
MTPARKPQRGSHRPVDDGVAAPRRASLSGSGFSAVVAHLLGALLLLPAAGLSQGLFDKVEIHGFGGWAYGKTDGLVALLGDEDGKYDNAELALNVSAHPLDNLSIVAQVFFDSNVADATGSTEAELDYAFAEWFFSDALKLRIGRVKHPFGLYGEIFDVGTLRPFYLLPQSIYGPNGFTAKAYNGIGLTGTRGGGGGWGLQYDLYAGQIEGDFDVPGLLLLTPELTLEPNLSLGFRVQDTLGLRLNVITPVDGLTVGFSAYRGDEEVGESFVSTDVRETYLVHLEYLTDRWSIRSEWGSLEHRDVYRDEGGYLEMAYMLDDRWQLAVRADDWKVDYPSVPRQFLSPIVRQLMRHEEVALGVNYWVAPSFVLRVNYHRVDGNRFAFLGSSEEIARALQNGKLDDRTGLLVIGTQFSF